MGIFNWFRGTTGDDESPAPIPTATPLIRPLPLPSLEPPVRALPVRPAPSALAPAYGIKSAIELMRTLPFDENPELVLRVLRKTLRSTGVSVEEIIDSAKSRESVLAANAASERAAIEQLEQQIAARRATIEAIEGELRETSGARERLEQAIEGETRVIALPPEVARLQAEVAAGRVPVPPFADAKSEALIPLGPSPEAHKPSGPPPIPKSGAPPFPKKFTP